MQTLIRWLREADLVLHYFLKRVCLGSAGHVLKCFILREGKKTYAESISSYPVFSTKHDTLFAIDRVCNTRLNLSILSGFTWSIIHCRYLHVFPNKIVFNPLKISFVLANLGPSICLLGPSSKPRVQPLIKCRCLKHFILVYSVCQSTRLRVPTIRVFHKKLILFLVEFKSDWRNYALFWVLADT